MSFSKVQKRTLFKKITSIFSAFVLGVHPAIGQSVTTTPISGDLEIYDAANGVPIVDIVDPNAEGVSHNIYGEFNVGEEGLIFNNADQNFVNTQLGGVIAGNANLTNGPASVILNEVLYNNPSELLGYMEVAGHQADVIIANPYGITCNGCGFINTDKATLTTGTPFYEGGEFKGFNVTKGAVAIGELGVDATGVSQFDIVSRQIKVEGTIYGQNVRLIAGQNNVIYATGAVTERNSDGSAKPELAIDSTVLGGMYANSITIISNEDGVGVKAPTNMAANAGEMTITADGRLVMGTAQAKGNVNVKASREVVVQNQIYSQAKVNIETARNLIVEHNAQVVSEGALTFQADGDIEFGNNTAVVSNGEELAMDAGGSLSLGEGSVVSNTAGTINISTVKALELTQNAKIMAVRDTTLAASSLLASGGNVIAAGVEDSDGNVQTASLDIDVSGDAELASSTVYASGDLSFDANTITIGSGSIDPAQFISGGDMALTASAIEARGATLNSSNDLAIASNTINTTDAQVQAQNDINITGLNGGDLDIAGGDYLAGNALSVEAASITNSADMMAIKGVLSFTSTSGNISNSGELKANNRIEINAANDFTHSGLLKSASLVEITTGDNFANTGSVESLGNIKLDIGKTLTNSGDIQASNLIQLASLDLDNQSSGMINANYLDLDIASSMTNAGAIDANGILMLDVVGTLTNSGNIEAGSSDIALDPNAPLNAAINLGGLTNTGTIQSTNGVIKLTSKDSFNNAGGTIHGGIGAMLELGVGLDSQNIGTISSGDWISIAGLDNGYLDYFNTSADQEFGAIGNLTIKAKSFDNAGAIYSATGNLNLTAENNITNTGVIYSGGNWMQLLLGGTLNNNGGTILAMNNMVIAGRDYDGANNDRAGKILNQHEGRIETIKGDMWLVADRIENKREIEEVIYDPAVDKTKTKSNRKTWNFGANGREDYRFDYVDIYQVSSRFIDAGPSEIISGGNLTINADTLSNEYSLISAIGNIRFDADNVQNISLEEYTQTTTWANGYRLKWDLFSKWTTGHWNEAPTTETVINDVIFGTIQAGGTISGNIGNLTNGVEDHVDNLTTGSFDREFTSLGTPGFRRTTGVSGLDMVSLSDVDPSLTSLANDPLFEYNPDASSGYLIETRYEFIDQSAFASSDYFLKAMGVTPTSEPPLRLGDAFVETTYIRDQLYEKLGITILDPDMSEADQIRAMYDNAIDVQKKLGLRPGVSLTPDQIAGLTEDIIWMETQIINGQEVLVPVVYLANGGAQYASLGGAQITAGGSINLNVDTLTNNGGSIIADEQLIISAAGDIINNGGLLQGGVNGAFTDANGNEFNIPSVLLQADGNVENYSGTITGVDITITAENIINETAKTRFGDDSNYADIASVTGSIGGTGDTTLIAVNDITFTGADLTAGGDATLQAGGDVTFAALELESGYSHSGKESGGLFGGSSSWSQKGYSLTHQTGNINIGDDLNIVSVQLDEDGNIAGGGNITFEGTQINAGGAANIAAYSGSVLFDAPQDLYYARGDYSGGNLLSSSEGYSETFRLTHQTAEINAETINIYGAGNVTLMGTNLATFGENGETLSGEKAAAAGALNVTAGNDLLFYSVQDIEAHREEHSSSTLGGLFSYEEKTQSLQTRYQDYQLASLTDINLSAGNDLVMLGGDISAGQNINLDIKGKTYIQGTVDTDFSFSHINDNNGWTITDTTDVDMTQTANMPSITAGGTNDFATLDNAIIGGRVFTGKYDADGNPIFKTGSTHSGGIVDTYGPMALLSDSSYQGADGTMLAADLAMRAEGIASGEIKVETTDKSGDSDDGNWRDALAEQYVDDSAIEIASIDPDGAGHEYLGSLLANGNTIIGSETELVSVDFYHQDVQLGVLSQAAIMLLTQGMGTWTSFAVSTLAEGIITGNFDIEEIVKSAAMTFVTAGFGVDAAGNPVGDFQGIGNEILGGMELNPSGIGGSKYFSEKWLVTSAVNAGVSSAASSAIYGTDFGEVFGSSLLTSFVDESIGMGIDGVSDIFGHDTFSVEKLLAKAAINCVGAMAKSSTCASGALGTIATEGYLGLVDTSNMTPEEIQRGVNSAAIILGALGSGGDMANLNATVSGANLDYQNNYLNVDQLAQYKNMLLACESESDPQACRQNVHKWAQGESDVNFARMESCGDDWECLQKHFDEIDRGNEIRTQIGELQLTGGNSGAGVATTLENMIEYQSLSYRQQRELYVSFGQDNCTGLSSEQCGTYFGNRFYDEEMTAKWIEEFEDIYDVSFAVDDEGRVIIIENVADTINAAKDIGLAGKAERLAAVAKYLKISGGIYEIGGGAITRSMDEDGLTMRDVVQIGGGAAGGYYSGRGGAAMCSPGGPYIAAICGVGTGAVGANTAAWLSGIGYDLTTYVNERPE